MLHLFLWPVLAVWMGIALVVGGSFMFVLTWCGLHMLRDVVVGQFGRIWCPAHARIMRVTGVPSRSVLRPYFLSLHRCEQFGGGPIRCQRGCLKVAPAQFAV